MKEIPAPFRSPTVVPLLIAIAFFGCKAGPPSIPTPIPPQVEFAAEETLLRSGETTRLCYSVANAQSARIDPDVGEVEPKEGQCLAISPTQTMTYKLAVTGLDGRTIGRTVTVHVQKDMPGLAAARPAPPRPLPPPPPPAEVLPPLPPPSLPEAAQPPPAAIPRPQAPPPPPNLEKIVDEELGKLTLGNILFNPAQEMRVGEKERVEVRIAKTITEDFFKGLKGRGVPQKEEIRVGTYMIVQLRGENFDIKELSDKEQLIGNKAVTQWDWDVVPLKSGDQTLSLTVTARIALPSGEKSKGIAVLDKKIKVKVNPVYWARKFLTENKQWVIPAIITVIIGSGLLGWILKRLKDSRRRGGTQLPL